MQRNSRREPPNGDDWWAMGELFALTVDQISAPVEGVHRAIAARWLGMAGTRGEPVGRGYDAFTKAVYGTVRLGATALGALVPTAASLTRGRDRRSTSSRFGSGLQATANALWGDELEARDSQLAIAMGFRNRDGDLVDLQFLEATYPSPSGHLVILLHGLGETERRWQQGSAASPHLADLLAEDAMVPIFLRYNTGRRVADNGEQLANLVSELTDDWPVPITSISFVCHSMGGLIARSALDSAIATDLGWTAHVQHLITLGTPHLGSPLEKGANFLAWGLDVAPESRPLSDFLRGRSAGIKDLRFGTTANAEPVDPGALVDRAAADVAPPPGVAQHFVAGVVTQDATHPVGALVGDLVVRVGSATGKGNNRRVESSDVLVLGRQRHFDLPTDPAVHQHIRSWLAS
jgi:pimeloyl-ACP methyl ester carboxylesterase